MSQRKNPTEVISFRLPAEDALKVAKHARKAKTTRAKFVEEVFSAAFYERINKPEKALVTT